jgi:acyl-CoA synthetase (AMP-forming)/AMP-acid ligase II
LRACPWLSVDGEAAAAPAVPEQGPPSEIALLQYTSGSTADSRGVMVTHGNLAHNAAMIERAFRLPPGARGVSWLPHFHDMGLIAGFVAPLSCGGESILMSPESFLRRPLRWLEAIAHYRGQVCGAPNFAYDLCVRRADRGPLPALDLGSWQTAFVGAEPVRFSTMQAFADRFRASGFEPAALTPCYGMAEATDLVSSAPPRGMPAFHSLSREALEAGQARPSAEPAALTLVGLGEPAAGTTVRIVDPASGLPLGSRRVGEIWVSGPQIARGYWGRDDDVFDAILADSPGKAFLRTGDLGFLTDEGELVFVERLKDVIVFNGQKHACHDLELTAGTSHEALSADSCVAISFDAGDRPHLVVIAELPRHALGQADDAARAIRAAWFTTHGLAARTIAFVARGKLSRTTSGKLQRQLSARRLVAGAMGVLAVNGDALPEAAPSPAGD